ncbi:MAG TPA: Wzz/FepE/Etk N-terminal domain-containing protein, partial [Methyloceanibacter sp.]|nr:Wzz/FepE/Etk N-terminal domain-containing protein [Methyloceanibacter sp.]
MTTSQDSSRAEDIDLQTLGRAIWRAKGWILTLAIGAGVLTYVVLSMMRPLYTSEARILIQNDESA